MTRQIDPRKFLQLDRRPAPEFQRKSISGRSDLPGQLEIPQTGEDMAGLAKQKAAAPLRPSNEQRPCDVGLFSDSAAQTDLIDQLKR